MKKLLLAVCLVATVTPTQAAVIMFDDKTGFVAATSATSAGSIPHTPSTIQFDVGPLTFSNALPVTINANLNFSTIIDEDFDLAMNGPENFNVDSSQALYAFGFDFHEPSLTTPPGPSFPDTCNTPVCIDSSFAINLFSGGSLVGSGSFARPDDVLTFVGIQSDTAFDRIEIRETVGNSDNEFFGNFMIATAVPGPSSWLLMVMGFAGVALGRRRKAG